MAFMGGLYLEVTLKLICFKRTQLGIPIETPISKINPSVF
jgi:hypothetical protein